MQTQIRVAAQHWMFKLAQYGSVSGYEDAQIEYAEVVAVMDSKTTDICRRMHGRILPISNMRNQLDGALKAGNSLKGMKKAHPMISQQDWNDRLSKLTSTKDLVRGGACMPPYHFNCRTRTVAYFEPGGFTGYNRTPGTRAKDPGLTDREIKNFSDELGRRVKERKLYWEPGRLESHARDHAREFGLERGDAEGYEKKLYELLEGRGDVFWLNCRKFGIQTAWRNDDGFVIVIGEGFRFKTGFKDQTSYVERQLEPFGETVEKR